MGTKFTLNWGRKKHLQTLQLGRAKRVQTSRQHSKVANNHTPPPMVSQQRKKTHLRASFINSECEFCSWEPSLPPLTFKTVPSRATCKRVQVGVVLVCLFFFFLFSSAPMCLLEIKRRTNKASVINKSRIYPEAQRIPWSYSPKFIKVSPSVDLC